MGTTSHSPAAGQVGGFYSSDIGNTWTAFENQFAYGKEREREREERKEGGEGGGGGKGEGRERGRDQETREVCLPSLLTLPLS